MLKKAFTMAEAILVMVILGIIATIMISTMRPVEFQDKGLHVTAKKMLGDIDSATTQILYNDTKLGYLTEIVRTNGTKYSWKDNSTDVLNLYKKYLTTVTRETVPSTSFCVTGGASRNAKAVYLKNGGCIGIYGSNISSILTRFPDEKASVTTSASQGAIFFDVNGEEEPNVVGKDRYILPVSDHGIQYESVAVASGTGTGTGSGTGTGTGTGGCPAGYTKSPLDGCCRNSFGDVHGTCVGSTSSF